MCTSNNLKTSTECTIEESPRASRKSSDGSSQPVSERLHAARCPRVTVWYSEPDGHVKAWHGVVVRVCRQNGLLVRFVGGTKANEDYWVSATEDDWAWGHAYADGRTTAPKGIARARPPARNVEQALALFEVTAQVGLRGWPIAFHECFEALDLLRWQLQNANWLRRDVQASLCTAGNNSDSADERGLTHLVDVAIALLGQVPPRNWHSPQWPGKGDWSSRLRDAHTPEALHEALVLAQVSVVASMACCPPPSSADSDGGSFFFWEATRRCVTARLQHAPTSTSRRIRMLRVRPRGTSTAPAAAGTAVVWRVLDALR